MEDISVHYGEKNLLFCSEPYFGNPADVKKQIEDDGLRLATFPEIMALLYSREKASSFGSDNILELFKTHLVFGFTALQSVYCGDKNGNGEQVLVVQNYPQFVDGQLVSNSESILIKDEKCDRQYGDLRRKYFFDSLGKSDLEKRISPESFLYNRFSCPIVPLVSYNVKETQLTSERRFPYTDDWGRYKENVEPAKYLVNKYYAFLESRIEKGKLYDDNNLPIRAASFGLLEK